MTATLPESFSVETAESESVPLCFLLCLGFLKRLIDHFNVETQKSRRQNGDTRFKAAVPLEKTKWKNLDDNKLNG